MAIPELLPDAPEAAPVVLPLDVPDVPPSAAPEALPLPEETAVPEEVPELLPVLLELQPTPNAKAKGKSRESATRKVEIERIRASDMVVSHEKEFLEKECLALRIASAPRIRRTPTFMRPGVPRNMSRRLVEPGTDARARFFFEVSARVFIQRYGRSQGATPIAQLLTGSFRRSQVP
jgi:hypothetical protein